MIVEWFFKLMANLADWALGLLPKFPVPSWVGDNTLSLASIMAKAAAFGYWVPFHNLGIMALSVGAVIVTAILIWIARKAVVSVALRGI